MISEPTLNFTRDADEVPKEACADPQLRSMCLTWALFRLSLVPGAGNELHSEP